MDLQIPHVPTLPPGTARSLWSVMIPVYNCIGFLPETLTSVIQQDMGEGVMQIEVVDDCSTDGNVEQLVQQIGKGRIRYTKQNRNVGSLENFHTCLLRAHGHHIHLLHGDDYVLPGFYTKMTDLFRQHPEVGAACCRYQFVDGKSTILNYEMEEMKEEGILKDWLQKLSFKQRLQYCSVVVRRNVYEDLGSFYGVNYGEDWLMWVRIAAKYRFAYSPEILASYRRQADSISGMAKQKGENIRKIRSVIDEMQKYLPHELQSTAYRNALKWYSRYCMSSAFSIYHKSGDAAAAVLQGRSALALRTDLYLLCRYVLLLVRISLPRNGKA